MNYSATSKKRISSDIFADSMQLILNKEKAVANQSNQSNEYQKKQEIKKNIANIIAILKTINIELQNEQDQEISLVLSQQKEIFNKILVQKQTGQKNNFKNTENETMSQLQNKIENLEKSVENKFNSILKSIEIQSQNQNQNQAQNQAQNQSQNQTKTYAQAATTNVEENNLQQTKKQQKQQEKEKEKEKYREKRLVIQVDKEIAKNIDSYTLRNQINDRFFVKENINSSVIATITKSFTSQSIILTTMTDFSADFLLQKKAVWEDIFSNVAQKIEKISHWSKVVVHGVPIRPFSMNEGLSLLKNEIEIFNPGLKLLKNPIWISSQENRQANRHASILIAVENAKQAELAIEKRLCIARN